jgi:hypothetical protein
VLKGLVDSRLVARKIAGLEGILKVFREPAGLGLRLFEVLDDVAMPEARAPPEPRAGVAGTSISGAGTGRGAGVRGKCARQPDTPVLRCAAKEYRPWKGTREKRDRISKKGRVKRSGLV